MYLFSALTIGLAGSLHCAGMCGPIAIAIPGVQHNWFTRAYSILLYNFGRVSTYAFMGAVFGALGRGIQMANFQQKLSIIVGVAMVVAALYPVFFRAFIPSSNFYNRFLVYIENKIAILMSKSSYLPMFSIGILNGFLPCGMVYMAVAMSVTTASWFNGMLFMVIFGVGTIPMLFTIGMIGNVLSISAKVWINKIAPWIVILIGVLFILRGMGLGIPFISPPNAKLEFH